MADRVTSIGSRVSLACHSCRSKKRRCDGRRPKCQLCTRLNTECTYAEFDGRSQPRRTGRTPIPTSAPETESVWPASVGPSSRAEDVTAFSERQSLVEATSGVMSAALVSAQIEGARSSHQGPVSARIAPWNLGLGCKSTDFGARSDRCDAEPIHHLVSWEEYSWFAMVFFTDVHPVFGTISEDEFWIKARARWQGTEEQQSCYDLLLALVAALGALFSQDELSEMRFFQHADKHLNTHLIKDNIFSQDLDSLILRTLYLRLTVGPNASWLSSCTMIGILQASIIETGLPEASPGSGLEGRSTAQTPQATQQDQHKRVLTAQLLCAWICNESGQCRPFDTNKDEKMNHIPSWAPKSPSWDLLRLYDMSEVLNPGRKIPDVKTLEKLLIDVCKFDTNHDVVSLSRTNLAVVVFRRLRSSSSRISNDSVTQLINVGNSGLDAVKRLAQQRKPWHHVANIPFQMLCTLLLLDTPESLALVRSALATVRLVAAVFDTYATQATLQIATQLVLLAQKRKQKDSFDLSSAVNEPSDMTEFSVPGAAQSFDGRGDGLDADTANRMVLTMDAASNFDNWDDIDWDQMLSNEDRSWSMHINPQTD